MRQGWLTLLAASCLCAGTASAQISGDVVKIGVLNDQSGLYADFGGTGSVIAARMAVEDFGGKVLGKPIEVLSADHQNKVDIASNIARQWMDVEGVDAFADLTNSAVALAVQNLTKERGKIALHSGPATTRLTNEDCSPTGFHWTFDTYSQAIGSARAILQEGGKEWFLLVADYAFGHQLQKDTTDVVEANGGKVLGAVRHPLNSGDFASYLLQAQASGAKVIGLANAGGDTTNAIKQAGEFGLTQAGQSLAALLLFINDVHSLGLKTAQGTYLTVASYWDMDDATRAWSKKFKDRVGAMPSMLQAGVYGSVVHYLKAVKAAGTDDADKVMAEMRKTPINDVFTRDAYIREDGRVVRDMYLAKVKSPAESKYDWDYFEIVRKIPAAEIVWPLSESKCPLVKK